MISHDLFLKASQLINEIHKADPTKRTVEGKEIAAELLYSQRMLQILKQFVVSPDFSLQLAAQCQHLERWKIARNLYSFDRKGYHQWRNAVMLYQIGKTKEILIKAGLDETDVSEITETLRKQGSRGHKRGQIILDTACIVFVLWYLEGFASKHESSKVKEILAKTMNKMSPEGLGMLKEKLPQLISEYS